MTTWQAFKPPPINDKDISWACNLLGLTERAFSGVDGGDPRMEVIKSTEPLDLEACPGSGKTTLLVAKLAILARNWTDRHRGICVLSHTNVARREIEQRLGAATEGRHLLGYPHFIGTIHAFINEFLALPWLRSKPWPVTIINDDVTLERRWRCLPNKLRSGLENNRHDQTCLKIASVDFGVGDLAWGKSTLGGDSPTYNAIRAACLKTSEQGFFGAPGLRHDEVIAAACLKTSEQGFFCYEEMFVWANELIDEVPGIRAAIRERFPLLFIDEVQDNSETQSAVLYRVFMEGGAPVCRQRFGDANQAIYSQGSKGKGAGTDRFPDPRVRRDIPSSHRFGQEIARIADPLALDPQSLEGRGPDRRVITSEPINRCAIFLFEDRTVANVLTTYAMYLTDVFSEQELKAGTFTAVGSVHRRGVSDANVPRHVGHYWPAYDYELTASEPTPSTFLQYVAAGRRLAHMSGEAHSLVEMIAAGILRLASLGDSRPKLGTRRRKHRQVLELLSGEAQQAGQYRSLLAALVVGSCHLSAAEWTGKWSSVIRTIAETICGGLSPGALSFLEWQSAADEATVCHSIGQRDNIFRYPADRPVVAIRVGSIHSVKGETHTATLALDTYYHEHSLKALKPWLLGQKRGKGKEKPRTLARLRQHYVAMTRPSHLLCLAMREDAFSDAEIDLLRSSPWRVARVTDADPTWL